MFIDLETTGLVKNVIRSLPPEEGYPNYIENISYNSARMVQASWIMLPDFDFGYDVNPKNVWDRIVQPNDFFISDFVSKIHGITNEIAKEKGKHILSVLKTLSNSILDADYIVGYNIFFDFNILLNEFNRYKNSNKVFDVVIEKMLNMKQQKKIIDVAVLCSVHCQPEGWKKYGKYGIPKQTVVYKEITGKELAGAHCAVFDIIATYEILKHIVIVNS
jgi:DNA polymerase III epsilon subunit-like protein